MHNYFTAALLAAFISLASCGGGGKTPDAGATKADSAAAALPGTGVRILDPEGNALIDSNAVVENLGGGFQWSEGPVYISEGDYLLFSDIPPNRIVKWKEGEGISTYLEPSGATGEKKPKKEPGSNGLLLDRDGKLVLCQHGDRRIGRMTAPLSAPKPEFETIVANYQGKRLNSPNDAAFHPNGNLYFTDPPYGLDGGTDDTAKELSFHGVYRVTPAGKIDLVTSEFNYPNGIAVSPDGKFLFVAHSDGSNPVWMKYELDGNGLSKNKSVFYRLSGDDLEIPGVPDGMKMHSKGYLFASGPGGIWILNLSGKPVARILTGQATSNCAFSPDEKTLFMTCDDFLYRIKLK